MNTKKIHKGQTFFYDKSLLAHHYIEKIASEYPNNIAITCGEIKISYKTLNESANQLARYLVSQNIVSGDLIGVYFTPSIDLIIAILAILKVGAAYLPLDLTYPEKLLDYIISDANPKVILTNTNNHFLNRKVVNLQEIKINSLPSTNLSTQVSSENPIYVIYTSGSTGEPKGVLIPHRAAVNHMLWMQAEFDFKITDKVLLKTPLTFDPSVWEIFVPLFVGAELVIAPAGSHIDTYLLLNSIINYNITTIQLVPNILHKFLSLPEIEKCTSLERVFVGGESLQSHVKKLFFSKIKCPLINLYGPTETTIDITYQIINNTQDEIDKNYIGKPIYNTELVILNDRMEICDVNEEGELYVSGVCLGLGYLNKIEVTKKCFIDHPFYPDKKIYKTGDIVRFTEKGLIEYICRKDKQTKINGVRVELAAIESKVMAERNIANCLVVKNTDGIYTYLVCYIVPKKGRNVDITQIKNSLNLFFPKSVMPKEFYLIDELPMLPNGKVDIKNLQRYNNDIKNKIQGSFETEDSIQEQLTNICERFLHSKVVGIDDDLYETGIDSLSCLILIEQIEKNFHIDLLVHEILSNRTVRKLSNLISRRLKHDNVDIQSNLALIPLKITGNKIPIFLIHPIGGTIFWYNNIASYIDSERPLYGIQDPGIESDDYFFDSLEEMASYYFAHIKKVQSKGPYIIGGASFGATVAIEICRHLNKDEIIAIPVLDGWAVYPEDLKDENYFRESMIKQQNDWKDKFDVYGYHEFTKMFNTQKHRLELLYKYKMRKIDHDIILFKSKEIMDIFKPIDCHDNNWGKYADGKLDIISIEGNHESMFQKPYVKDLSLKLSELLESRSHID